MTEALITVWEWASEEETRVFVLLLFVYFTGSVVVNSLVKIITALMSPFRRTPIVVNVQNTATPGTTLQQQGTNVGEVVRDALEQARNQNPREAEAPSQIQQILNDD